MSAKDRKDIKARHLVAQEFVASVYRDVFHQELDAATLGAVAAKLARALPRDWRAIGKGEA